MYPPYFYQPYQYIQQNDFIDEYPNQVYSWNQPLEIINNDKSVVNQKLIRKPTKKDSRCYTCKPRGKVKKHVINTSESGKFYFHHDMHKRPIIIMTPSRHVESIDELTCEEQIDLFKSLKQFTSFWDINDYQLSYNSGNWQNHDHFHCKIRMSEKIIDRMRRDHFKMINLNSNYENSREDEEDEGKNFKK